MKNVFMGLVSRPAIFADSLSEMNSSALTRDADAPVMSVYHAEIRIIRHDLVFLTAGKFPKTDVIFSSIQYITPRCIPERASMCDAPLSLNASFIVLLTSDLSPDSRAFARALQSLSPNGTASIASLNASEHETAASCSREAGRNVSYVHFDYIDPLPKNTAEIFSRFGKIFVCELNSGHFAGYLRSVMPQFGYLQYNKVQGQPFLVQELFSAIMSVSN